MVQARATSRAPTACSATSLRVVTGSPYAANTAMIRAVRSTACGSGPCRETVTADQYNPVPAVSGFAHGVDEVVEDGRADLGLPGVEQGEEDHWRRRFLQAGAGPGGRPSGGGGVQQPVQGVPGSACGSSQVEDTVSKSSIRVVKSVIRTPTSAG